jgi:hypothetical protein
VLNLNAATTKIPLQARFLTVPGIMVTTRCMRY